MYTVKNDELSISILDPEADRERFGPRYCTGGYIFQIDDLRHGPLLSGPTYPGSFNWFDGQGIPDSFAQNPLLDPTGSAGRALVIGIGVCDTVERTVEEFSAWAVTASTDAVTMVTAHRFGSYDVGLERAVSLAGRTVRSAARVVNRGKGLLPIRWFPHPFYPQGETDDLIRVSPQVHLAPGAGHEPGTGYEIAPNGFIRRLGWPWSGGYFMPLKHDASASPVIVQTHPVLGLVAATMSYRPAFFPIWGNSNTFSWEPYLEETIGAGGELEWWVDYQF